MLSSCAGRTAITVHAALSSAVLEPAARDEPVNKPFKVIIAGAGIGGLVLAVALLRKGFDVQVLERDLTAIRGEGKYRGPIQVQSNALGALEAIDPAVADEIMAEGCITGDRINGLCDGVTGDWYVKFDTFHPAADRGLPVTRVISRVTLQNILANAVNRYGGPDAILGNSHVTGYSESVDPATGRPQVTVNLEDGRSFTGDMLVGADGIWSKIRKHIIGDSQANYSQYTCYTGISDFTPADIDVVGYRVFLGNGQYFVSSDVGGGKMQWYGFHKEAPGGTDPEGQRKARLLQLFGHWNDAVVDLIKATPEDDILRRDIYDRAPIFKWHQGRVALLGDSAHAMQPNLGQGGCMAIEDAYELANDLAEALQRVDLDPSRLEVDQVLRQYQEQRMMRAAAIHGMAGMAAFMASTYKAYLGEGLPGPLAALTALKIPHPGRVIGQVILKLTMPGVLSWVLGGNVQHIQKSRAAACRIQDVPRAFKESQFPTFMWDDEAIVRAVNADWLLMTERASTCSQADATSTQEAKGIYISDQPAVIGRVGAAGTHLSVDDAGVAERHASVWRESCKASSSHTEYNYFLKDLGSGKDTWVNGRKLAAGAQVQLHPGDTIEFASHPSNEVYKVKMQHVTLRTSKISGHAFNTLVVGKREQEGAEAQSAQSLAVA
eukprot:CAMPEP_0202891454 /NCGR_PEP_ID=MMETSP1392-20130828/1504_1 /ASSEMBLY_ACC=CAM_ASM_000868 /TAXON_ID=225041 /ORGANISM="Chlamydomonas chlamydogama, Strain SAG 11-48b" /LENGTH=662 /DNA_ID=CAMNT_0049575203 /DNA_START=251 /DNA_END=2239 /DNA_ORIENTATION=-